MFHKTSKKFLINSIVITIILLFQSFAFAAHITGHYTLSSSTGVTGGYCQITTNSYPNATTTDFSAAYVMILNDDGSGANEYQYAQAGWIRGQNSPVTMNYFTEWSNSASDWNRIRNAVGPAVGSKHAYKLEIVSGTVYAYEDGASIGSHSLTWSTIKSIQYSGERCTANGNNNAAFPGKASLPHETIDCPQYKLNGAWTPITTMYWPTPDAYGARDTSKFNNSNNYRFDIWDTRY